MTDCIRMTLDCAGTCRTAVEAMVRDSTSVPAIGRAAAEVCAACAEECEKHESEHCDACARACRRALEQLQGAMAGGTAAAPTFNR